MKRFPVVAALFAVLFLSVPVHAQFGVSGHGGIAHFDDSNWVTGAGAMAKISNPDGKGQISVLFRLDGSVQSHHLAHAALGAGLRLFDCRPFHVDVRGGMAVLKDRRAPNCDDKKYVTRWLPFVDVGAGLENKDMCRPFGVGVVFRFYNDLANHYRSPSEPIVFVVIEWWPWGAEGVPIVTVQ